MGKQRTAATSLINLLKEYLSFRDVMDLLRIPMGDTRGDRLTIRCPSTWHDDTNPSCLVYHPDATGSAGRQITCRGEVDGAPCDLQGSILDLYAATLGIRLGRSGQMHARFSQVLLGLAHLAAPLLDARVPKSIDWRRFLGDSQTTGQHPLLPRVLRYGRSVEGLIRAPEWSDAPSVYLLDAEHTPLVFKHLGEREVLVAAVPAVGGLSVYDRELRHLHSALRINDPVFRFFGRFHTPVDGYALNRRQPPSEYAVQGTISLLDLAVLTPDLLEAARVADMGFSSMWMMPMTSNAAIAQQRTTPIQIVVGVWMLPRGEEPPNVLRAASGWLPRTLEAPESPLWALPLEQAFDHLAGFETRTSAIEDPMIF